MSTPQELSDQWEIVKRHGNYGWGAFVAAIIDGLLGGGGGPGEPASITLTVRHKSTGATHVVTANNEREAITKVNSGQFDRSAT
jgi:hypothetical protein